MKNSNSIYISNLFSHKNISLCFIFGAISIIGTYLFVLIRLELALPGNQILLGNHQLYNVIVTAHAFIMIFFFLMPVLIGGFGNVKKSNIIFPRLNNINFLLLSSIILIFFIMKKFNLNEEGFYLLNSQFIIFKNKDLKNKIFTILNSFIMLSAIILFVDICKLLMKEENYNNPMFLNWYIYLFVSIIVFSLILLIYILLLKNKLNYIQLILASLLNGVLCYFLTYVKINIIFIFDVVMFETFFEYLLITIKTLFHYFKDFIIKIFVSSAECAKKKTEEKSNAEASTNNKNNKNDTNNESYGFMDYAHKSTCDGKFQSFLESIGKNYRDDPGTSFLASTQSRIGEKIIINRLKKKCSELDKEFEKQNRK